MGEQTKLGRYTLYGEIASGGMARVHLGRVAGAMGFARTVAIKRIHSHFATDQEFVDMFVDEARLAARIQHPNVVSTLDAVAEEGEVFLVMEYVHGVSLAVLVRAAKNLGVTLTPGFAVAVMSAALRGLHAAHESTDEQGQPLCVVHRDVSPQNILVGVDGIARVLDFGVAKATGRIQTTREGQIKGKLAYASPEQLSGEPCDPRSDVYSAAVVLWEALASRRLFEAETEAGVYAKVLMGDVVKLSAVVPSIDPKLEAIVMRGLERDAGARFQTAKEMADALEKSIVVESPSDVTACVNHLAGAVLAARARLTQEIARGVSEPDLPMYVSAAKAAAAPAPDLPTQTLIGLGEPEPNLGSKSSVETYGSSLPGASASSGSKKVVTIVAVLGALVVLVAAGLIGRAALQKPATPALVEVAVAATTSAPAPPPPPAAPTETAEVTDLGDVKEVASAAAPVRRVKPPAKPACRKKWVDDAGITRYNKDCVE